MTGGIFVESVIYVWAYSIRRGVGIVENLCDRMRKTQYKADGVDVSLKFWGAGVARGRARVRVCVWGFLGSLDGQNQINNGKAKRDNPE